MVFQFLFEFIAKEDYLSGEEVSRLFEQYLSPKSKKEMLTTYQVWVQKGKKEGLQEGKQVGIQEGQTQKARLVVLRGRWKGLSADFLVDVSELSHVEVENLLKGYDQTYQLWQSKKKPAKVEHLTKNEVDYLLDLFDKNQN